MKRKAGELVLTEEKFCMWAKGAFGENPWKKGARCYQKEKINKVVVFPKLSLSISVHTRPWTADEGTHTGIHINELV